MFRLTRRANMEINVNKFYNTCSPGQDLVKRMGQSAGSLL